MNEQTNKQTNTQAAPPVAKAAVPAEPVKPAAEPAQAAKPWQWDRDKSKDEKKDKGWQDKSEGWQEYSKQGWHDKEKKKSWSSPDETKKGWSSPDEEKQRWSEDAKKNRKAWDEKWGKWEEKKPAKAESHAESKAQSSGSTELPSHEKAWLKEAFADIEADFKCLDWRVIKRFSQMT